MDGWIVASSGGLLRRTELPELYVWLSAAAVFVVVALLAWRRPSNRAIRRGYVLLGASWLVAATAMAICCFRHHQVLCEEDHVIEWLSAHFLLAAGAMGLIAVVRLARRGRPSPLGLGMSAACLFVFWRELEWGQPFFGVKLWYSRNFFTPRAYFDPGYFREFTKDLHLSDRPLYTAHLITSLSLIAITAFCVVYFVRHRKVLVKELARFPRQAYGRYFLLGVGIYVGSQILGSIFRKLLKTKWLEGWREGCGVSHRVLNEPLELLGAATFLVAMLMFFKLRRADLPRRRRLRLE